HFDQATLDRLRSMGVQQAFVTLHVGAGTFQPVRVDDLSQHQMHAERYSVPQDTLAKVQATRKAGGRVVAVGTTSVRALEAAAQQQGGKDPVDGDPVVRDPVEGDTRLFITPGYHFAFVDAL